MKISGRKMEAEIPTASMADIAFLLICFFMVTTVFSTTRGMDFRLPAPSEDDATEREEAVHIRVDASSRIFVDGKQMEAARILPYLRPKLQRWPDKPIIVTTDAQAPYSGFIEVYDELRQAEKEVDQGGLGLKIKNVSIPSLKEIEELKRRFGEDIFG